MPTHPALPGVNALGCGFNPFDSTADRYKPKLLIFDFAGDDKPYADSWSAGTYTSPDGHSYSVPKGIKIDPTGSSGNLETSVSESQSEVEEKLAAKANVSSGFGLFRAEFAASYDADSKTVNSRSFASSRMVQTMWRLNLDPSIIDHRPVLDSAFGTAMNRLPKACRTASDRMAWDTFFLRYGTHFVQGCTVGGFSEFFVSVAKSDKMTKSKVAAQIEIQYGSYFKGGGSVERERLDDEYQQNERHSISLWGGDTSLVGLMENDKGKYAEWIRTIAANPASRDFVLREIWTLSEDPELRASAQAAFADYCYRNSTYAVHLDGKGAFVDIVSQTGLDRLHDASFEAWIYPTSEGGASKPAGIILNKEDSYEIARNPDGEIIYAIAIHGGGSWKWVPGGRKAPANLWTHVALIRSAGNGAVTLLVNGQPAHSGKSLKGDIAVSIYKLMLGGRPTANQFLQGYMQEVRIWNRALSVDEVQRSMYDRLNGDEPGLVGLWTLNDATGDDVADRSITPNPGKLRNGANWAEPPAPSPVTMRMHSKGLTTPALEAALRAVSESPEGN